MKKIKFQKPTGTHDILSFEYKYYKKISEAIDKIADFYGFGKIETPMIEDEELFTKGVGIATDIVKKEMFTLKTKGEDRLALRPEGTAPIVRAYIEHGMAGRPQPVKLFYMGPFFRYERPQAGRYRQFWQFGFETIGEKKPIADAQIIQLVYSLLSDFKLKNISIEVNSIGDKECRPAYRRVLTRYLRSKADSLCADCKRRLKENPLRILDCKNEKCQEIIKSAPQSIDHLCPDCRLHFKKTLEYLDELELPYILNPHLVRGLDYYTKTVFEFFITSEGDKSLALGGGGRYDDLVKLLGGKDTPAVGAAFGVERVIQAIKAVIGAEARKPKDKIFLAQLGDLGKRKSLRFMEELRKSNLSVSESFGKDSLRDQMSRAARVGAKLTVIIGQQEALDETVIIRNMENGSQETVQLKDAVKEIKKRIKK
ncbi:MAG: histidine--tRNA ligase [Minisyncoccales bacterium]|jgi:histidyl-tRNA synthetase